MCRKNHSSPGTPFYPVFGLVSRVCPNIDKLCPSAAVRLRTGGQKLAQILSVYTKKIAGGRDSAPDRAQITVNLCSTNPQQTETKETERQNAGFSNDCPTRQNCTFSETY